MLSEELIKSLVLAQGQQSRLEIVSSIQQSLLMILFLNETVRFVRANLKIVTFESQDDYDSMAIALAEEHLGQIVKGVVEGMSASVALSNLSEKEMKMANKLFKVSDETTEFEGLIEEMEQRTKNQAGRIAQQFMHQFKDTIMHQFKLILKNQRDAQKSDTDRSN
jgi:hypothetical protein